MIEPTAQPNPLQPQPVAPAEPLVPQPAISVTAPIAPMPTQPITPQPQPMMQTAPVTAQPAAVVQQPVVFQTPAVSHSPAAQSPTAASGSNPTPTPIKQSRPMPKLALIVGGLLVLAAIGAGAYFFGLQKYLPGSMVPSVTPVPTVEVKACTLEAKVCPDGSSVGRTGPNCEFAECPEVTVTVFPTPEVTLPVDEVSTISGTIQDNLNSATQSGQQ